MFPKLPAHRKINPNELLKGAIATNAARVLAETPAGLAHVLSGQKWKLAPHLILLSRVLVDLAAGRIKRLVIEMPPRHGKSELASHWFPVWYFKNWPERRIILTSYEADFAATWGRKTRNTIEEHSKYLGIDLSHDSTAANRWNTSSDGGMVTAGVGGPITGRGANVLIVDDPVKNIEEAYSPTQRAAIWDWWRSTAYTRLEPDGVVIVIMTRWHRDDLVGRLLDHQQEDNESWHVLRLPALAEENDVLGRAYGQPLWPARYDHEALVDIKAHLGTILWLALYQQNPTDREGAMFQRQWFKIVPEAPADALPVRYWDQAATDATKSKSGNEPAYTSGAKVSELKGQYWIHRIDRTQSSPKGVEDFIRQHAELDGRPVSVVIEQEPGSSGIATISHYQRNVLRGYDCRGDRPTGSKVVRANPVAAAAEAGNVFLVAGPWVGPFLDEAELFPLGKFKDQIDSVSGAFKELGAVGQPGLFFA